MGSAGEPPMSVRPIRERIWTSNAKLPERRTERAGGCGRSAELTPTAYRSSQKMQVRTGTGSEVVTDANGTRQQ